MHSLIRTLKKIDRIFGPWLLKFLPQTAKFCPSNRKLDNILVIRPGGLGDALLLLPVLKKIAVTKNVKIDVLCEPRNKPAFENVNFIGQIYSYQNIGSLAKALLKKYDAVIDTEQSYILSAVITRCVRALVKIGFDTNDRGKMYTLTVPYDQDQYEPEVFYSLFSVIFNLAAGVKINPPYFKDTLPVKIPTKKSECVCLFPGTTVLEKKWPEENWAHIVNWLIQNKFTPVLLGGQAEKKQCESIIALSGRPQAINLCGKLSISQTAMLFKQIRLLISTDSGILHLAMLCNVPTISLFGPSSSQKWAPKGDDHQVVHKTLPCSPCSRFGTIPSCTKQNACMAEIRTKDVIRRVESIVDKIK
nr:glycosyltransferase family 9 protein [uncultured Desulfobacter sp.]